MRVDSRAVARLYEADARRCVQEIRESLTAGREGRVGGLRATDFSIRDLAESLIPDGREFVRAMNPRFADSEETQTILEAGVVNSAAFKNITGQIIYSRMMEAYNKPGYLWPSLVEVIPTTLNGEKIPGISGPGDESEEVHEGQPYPALGLEEDWVETPATVKRGNMILITKEAIYFDRTNLVLRQADTMGDVLALNKEKRAIDMVLGVTNTYKWKGTAYDTYQTTTPWININASNGLSTWANIDDALQLFGGLTDPATGEPIIVVPRTILLNSGKRATANYILNATQVVIDPNANTGTSQYQALVNNNTLVPGQYNVLSSPWVDARYTAGSVTSTTWYFGDFPRAFAWMENWPAQVIPMPANSWIEFERDVVAGWRASERGVMAVKNPRYAQKNTA
jgi:hypothetical protein